VKALHALFWALFVFLLVPLATLCIGSNILSTVQWAWWVEAVILLVLFERGVRTGYASAKLVYGFLTETS
jgi:hypothetical protein